MTATVKGKQMPTDPTKQYADMGLTPEQEEGVELDSEQAQLDVDSRVHTLDNNGRLGTIEDISDENSKWDVTFKVKWDDGSESVEHMSNLRDARKTVKASLNSVNGAISKLEAAIRRESE